MAGKNKETTETDAGFNEQQIVNSPKSGPSEHFYFRKIPAPRNPGGKYSSSLRNSVSDLREQTYKEPVPQMRNSNA